MVTSSRANARVVFLIYSTTKLSSTTNKCISYIHKLDLILLKEERVTVNSVRLTVAGG